jgi:hypothetical protein
MKQQLNRSKYSHNFIPYGIFLCAQSSLEDFDTGIISCSYSLSVLTLTESLPFPHSWPLSKYLRTSYHFEYLVFNTCSDSSYIQSRMCCIVCLSLSTIVLTLVRQANRVVLKWLLVSSWAPQKLHGHRAMGKCLLYCLQLTILIIRPNVSSVAIPTIARLARSSPAEFGR